MLDDCSCVCLCCIDFLISELSMITGRQQVFESLVAPPTYTMYMYMYIIVFGKLIWLRASYLALHSSLLGPDDTVNYDYIVTNNINCLLIG